MIKSPAFRNINDELDVIPVDSELFIQASTHPAYSHCFYVLLIKLDNLIDMEWTERSHILRTLY